MSDQELAKRYKRLKRLAWLALAAVIALVVIVLANSTSEGAHTVVTLNDWIVLLAGLSLLVIFVAVIYALKFWIWRLRNGNR